MGVPSGAHVSESKVAAFLSQCSIHEDSTPTFTSGIIILMPASIRDSMMGM